MISTKPDRFPTTRWSVIRMAGSANEQERRAALTTLAEIYREPIRQCVLNWRGVRSHEVDEIVQEFLTLKWLEQGFLTRADPSRRFRYFLKTSVENFVNNWIRAAATRQRATERLLEQGFRTELVVPDPFEVAWARQVLDQTIEHFRNWCNASGRPDLWTVFDGRVLGPTLRGESPVDYEVLVRQLGAMTPDKVPNLLVTAKRAVLRSLKEVVSQYEGSDGERGDQDVDAEVEDLLRILRLAGRR